ncbi:hypothetical protein OX284_016500 [Flavobacterium sp. SUN046]|uniref:hypothetical protein n=1 Tax=Flavobacterium sp. SUN046 TaxID=3002440 RepID=UPI002DB904CD|nr:hypothetical protein [Flavobacterium sp. SUN046]MEC4051038.1 hypothetical protein [Flavobacterium sp. SUN046]
MLLEDTAAFDKFVVVQPKPEVKQMKRKAEAKTEVKTEIKTKYKNIPADIDTTSTKECYIKKKTPKPITNQSLKDNRPPQ